MSVFKATLSRIAAYPSIVSRLAWGLLGVVAMAFVVFWAALQFWIVPRIGEWRGEAQSLASTALGLPVEIGTLEAESRGWWRSPVWVARDVRWRDAQGQVAFEMQRLQASLGFMSLWHKGFEQVVMDAPVVHVRHSADGRWWVAGLDVSPKDESDSAGARWLLAQTELAVRGGRLLWTNERQGQNTVEFTGVQAVLRRQGDTHSARLDLKPPVAWGEAVRLQANWTNTEDTPDAAPWAHWDGTVHAMAPVINTLPWLSLLAVWPEAPHVVTHVDGSGALQAWVTLKQGQPQAATVDLNWPILRWQTEAQAPVHRLSELKGVVRAEWGERLAVSFDRLSLVTETGLPWRSDWLRLERRRSADGLQATDELQARGVDLSTLEPLARQFVLPVAIQEAMQRWDVAGRVDELNAQWHWDWPQPQAEPVWRGPYRAAGQVSRVAWVDHGSEQVPPGPGWRGLNVNFSLHQDGGQAQLKMDPGELNLLGILGEPRVVVDQLEGALTWAMDEKGIQASIKSLSLATPDWHGDIQGQWRTLPGATGVQRFPGVLELKAQLRDVALNTVHRYVPLQVSEGVRRYVREGFVDGRAPLVTVRVEGDLTDLPLGRPNAKGVFMIDADLRDVDFAYLPPYLQNATDLPWPRLQQASAALRFDGRSLSVGPIEADVQDAPGVRVSQGQVAITDLAQGPAQLSVNVALNGPAPALLHYVNHSPLNRMTAGALALTQAEGNIAGGLALQMPFTDEPHVRLQGHLAMNGLNLRHSPGTPQAQNIVGRIEFDEKGFTVQPTQARVLGSDWSIKGGTVAVAPGQPSQLAFDVQGQLTAEGLRQAQLGTLSRLAQRMSGSTPVQLRLGVRGGVPEIDLRSDLVGWGMDLPAPLNKAATAAWPLRLRTSVERFDGVRAVADRWWLQLGKGPEQIVDLDWRRDWRAQPLTVSGHAWVGDAPREPIKNPGRGWDASVRLPELDVDAWQAVLASVTPPTLPAPEAPGPTPAMFPGTAYWPRQVRVEIETVRAGRRSFGPLALQARHEAGEWVANVNAKEAQGEVRLRLPKPGQVTHVYARLSHLTVPAADAQAAKAEVQAVVDQPTFIPSLDVVVDRLSVGPLDLGRLEIEAEQQDNGIQHSWFLRRLRMTLPEATLNASGQWASVASADARSTGLQFDLDIRDAGALLNRVGQPGNLAGGKGQVSGTAAWAGSPITPDLPSLSGQWTLNLKDGQILKFKPGAGRLLGVLSLQALPRLFVLDFRNAFVEGFVFDEFSGKVDVAQGVATSQDLRIRSLLVDVKTQGQVDLVRREQDLDVLIVPEINVGAASLAMIAINPVLGWSTLLAQVLMRTPLKNKVTQYMRVTGTWADPLVTKTSPPARKAPQ
ncbi:MAG: hypothetical protein RI914_931 [Pseudomonadota bacterium]|jgi:uncharacterized protein (TIGR02099 family)